ncbi:ankyrin repeat domain-containing protein [Vampirovibrio sp.]|uniref:ankyrin repeat domain-containing protein n=1 Tax=Vampirovibrio sp. TaxID=2717857 RepID=UPI0035937F8C
MVSISNTIPFNRERSFYEEAPSSKKRKLDSRSVSTYLENPKVGQALMLQDDLVMDAFQKVLAAPAEEKTSALRWLNQMLKGVPDYFSRFQKTTQGQAPQVRRNPQGFPLVNQLLAENPAHSLALRNFLRANHVLLASEDESQYAFSQLLGLTPKTAQSDLEQIKAALRTPGLNINAVFNDSLEHSPLHLFVILKKMELLKETLQAPGINPNTFRENNTPVQYAAIINNAPAIKLLARHPKTDINLKAKCCDGTALHHAVQNYSFEAVDALITEKALLEETDHKGWTPLHYAAKGDDHNILKKLLENGAFVNAKNESGHTPTHLALESLNTRNLKTLIEAKAALNQKDLKGKAPLHYAILLQKPEMVHELLVGGANPDQKSANYGFSPLMLAIRLQDFETVNTLINLGANCNSVDKTGSTALHYAVTWGGLNLVNQLLANHASANVHNDRGKTALHIAIQKNQPAIIRRLLQVRGTINAVDNQQNTVLHFAAVQTNPEILKMLLQEGIKNSLLNGASFCGNTPLHYAALMGSPEIVEVLLNQPGIELSRRNQWNETPLDLALKNTNPPQVAQLLKMALIR